jgi:hypothetical protein
MKAVVLCPISVITPCSSALRSLTVASPTFSRHGSPVLDNRLDQPVFFRHPSSNFTGKECKVKSLWEKQGESCATLLPQSG